MRVLILPLVLLAVALSSCGPLLAQKIEYRGCRAIDLEIIDVPDTPLEFMKGTRICRPSMPSNTASRDWHNDIRYRLIIRNESDRTIVKALFQWELRDSSGATLGTLKGLLDKNQYFTGPMRHKAGQRLTYDFTVDSNERLDQMDSAVLRPMGVEFGEDKAPRRARYRRNKQADPGTETPERADESAVASEEKPSQATEKGAVSPTSETASESGQLLVCRQGHTYSEGLGHRFCPQDGTPLTKPKLVCEKGHEYLAESDYKFCPQDGLPLSLQSLNGGNDDSE